MHIIYHDLLFWEIWVTTRGHHYRSKMSAILYRALSKKHSVQNTNWITSGIKLIFLSHFIHKGSEWVYIGAPLTRMCHHCSGYYYISYSMTVHVWALKHTAYIIEHIQLQIELCILKIWSQPQTINILEALLSNSFVQYKIDNN